MKTFLSLFVAATSLSSAVLAAPSLTVELSPDTPTTIVAGENVIGAKFVVKASSVQKGYPVLFEAWQLQFFVTNGNASDLGLIRAISSSGAVISQFRVSQHLSDPHRAGAILSAQFDNYSENRLRNYKLLEEETVGIEFNTSKFAGTEITIVSEEFMSFDSGNSIPYGEILFETKSITTKIFVESQPPLPDAATLTSLSSTSGPVGTPLVITGTGFSSGNSVSFQGVNPGDRMTVEVPATDSKTLRLKVPEVKSVGTYRVSVDNGGGVSYNYLEFEVTPPPTTGGGSGGGGGVGEPAVQIDTLVSSSGRAGQQIVLTGKGFSEKNTLVLSDTNGNWVWGLFQVPAIRGNRIHFTVPGREVSPGTYTLTLRSGWGEASTEFRILPEPKDVTEGAVKSVEYTETDSGGYQGITCTVRLTAYPREGQTFIWVSNEGRAVPLVVFPFGPQSPNTSLTGGGYNTVLTFMVPREDAGKGAEWLRSYRTFMVLEYGS